MVLVEEPDSRPPYAQPWKLGLVLQQPTSGVQNSSSSSSSSSKANNEAASHDHNGTPRLLPQLKADFVRAHGETNARSECVLYVFVYE